MYGWTVGAELGLRLALMKPLYLEVSDKVAYSQLNNLPAYRGTLKQSMVMNAVVVSLGYTFDAPF